MPTKNRQKSEDELEKLRRENVRTRNDGSRVAFSERLLRAELANLTRNRGSGGSVSVAAIDSMEQQLGRLVVDEAQPITATQAAMTGYAHSLGSVTWDAGSVSTVYQHMGNGEVRAVDPNNFYTDPLAQTLPPIDTQEDRTTRAKAKLERESLKVLHELGLSKYIKDSKPKKTKEVAPFVITSEKQEWPESFK